MPQDDLEEKFEEGGPLRIIVFCDFGPYASHLEMLGVDGAIIRRSDIGTVQKAVGVFSSTYRYD